MPPLSKVYITEIKQIIEEVKTGKFQKNKLEFIENPSVLEFLGLPGNTGYNEVVFVLLYLPTEAQLRKAMERKKEIIRLQLEDRNE
jgi:hypothetical protein